MTARITVDPHCRNCGALAPDRYCPQCGQETTVKLPTARQFMREATGRLITWDGRLWRTLHTLAFRPGALTKAYLAGRRRYYVRPARLFLAMSLILFAVIRFEIGPLERRDLVVFENGEKVERPRQAAVKPWTLPAAQKPAKPRAESPKDAAGKDAAAKDDASNDDDAKDSATKGDLWSGEMLHVGTGDLAIVVDNAMNLSVLGKDSLIARELRERFDRFNRLPSSDKAERIVDGALRYGSYLLFLLLPLFAALQYVAYAGRGRGHPGRPRLYAEHLVYGAHVHTFLFLALIFAILVPWEPLRWALLIWMVVYVVRARRSVYGGSRLGGAARALFVGSVYVVAQLVGLAGLFVVSILFR